MNIRKIQQRWIIFTSFWMKEECKTPFILKRKGILCSILKRLFSKNFLHRFPLAASEVSPPPPLTLGPPVAIVIKWQSSKGWVNRLGWNQKETLNMPNIAVCSRLCLEKTKFQKRTLGVSPCSSLIIRVLKFSTCSRSSQEPTSFVNTNRKMNDQKGCLMQNTFNFYHRSKHANMHLETSRCGVMGHCSNV